MFVKNKVETNSVVLRMRKTCTNPQLATHTVLTDDVFSYVDFFFKTHKKKMKDSNGKTVNQNYSFYWEQSRCFYEAAKVLPIESAPLPMYYCMLNAVKAYLIYNAISFSDIEKDLKSHGLSEYCDDDTNQVNYSLDGISVFYKNFGVFPIFCESLDRDYNTKWAPGKEDHRSVKHLMKQLPFVHAAYASTYKLPRKDELFIPLSSCPEFHYGSDRRIYLVANLDRRYFKTTATSIPEDIKRSIPSTLIVDPNEEFQLISSLSMRKKEITDHYSELRKNFAYIRSEKRLWYLVRNMNSDESSVLNSMIVELALVHRFSEIVRYKPEQMVRILQSKENWLVHEFLSLVLDQFMDEISCEITKQEIMPTRVK